MYSNNTELLSLSIRNEIFRRTRKKIDLFYEINQFLPKKKDEKAMIDSILSIYSLKQKLSYSDFTTKVYNDYLNEKAMENDILFDSLELPTTIQKDIQKRVKSKVTMFFDEYKIIPKYMEEKSEIIEQVLSIYPTETKNKYKDKLTTYTALYLTDYLEEITPLYEQKLEDEKIAKRQQAIQNTKLVVSTINKTIFVILALFIAIISGIMSGLYGKKR